MLSMFIESLKNMTKKPETIGYPFEPSPEPKNYRGTILYEEELCIFCDRCEDICPPGAIKFEIVDVESNKREYNYNPYLCIYCRACVDVCPKADEGCLVQAETRIKPLGRDETLPKDKKLGYFMNKVTSAKDLDLAWDELENRCEASREAYAKYKEEQRKRKREEAARKKAEAEAKKEEKTSTAANKKQ